MILLPSSPKPVQSLYRLSHPGSNLTHQEGPTERVLLISELIYILLAVYSTAAYLCTKKFPPYSNKTLLEKLTVVQLLTTFLQLKPVFLNLCETAAR